MPIESAEARETRREMEWARRLLSRPEVRAVLLSLEAAAITIDTSVGCLTAAIEAGCLAAERVPPSGDYMVRRGDLLDFVAAHRPIVQAVPRTPPDQPEQQPMEGPEKP